MATLTCEKCGKSHSIDARFCAGCGEPLSVDLLQAALDENRKLIQEGKAKLAADDALQAQLIAEEAVRTDPSNREALALLGDCHERQGRIARALECYEAILELMPDSTLDRLRVSYLRRRLGDGAQPPQRKLVSRNVAVALAVTVLLAAFGTIGATLAGRGEQPTKLVLRDGSKQEGFGPGPAMNSGSQPEASGPVKPVERQSPLNTPPEPTQGQPPSTPAGDSQRQLSPRPSREILPLPIPKGSIANDESPLTLPRNLALLPKSPPKQADPDPILERTGDGPTQAAATQEGIIDIRPSAGQATVGGSDVASGGSRRNQAEALVQVGRQRFMLGDYGAAADAYAKALQAGADPGFVGQRLAQALERLGRTDQAIAAYSRAIAALEGQLKSGRGDGDRVGTTLASCRQAMKILQGK